MIRNQLSEHFKTSIENIHLSPLSGGDINESFLARISGQEFFIKANSEFSILEAEYRGLMVLNKLMPGHVPSAVSLVPMEQVSLLILEYINPRPADIIDFQGLGELIARLHSISNTHFGLDHDNFIGTLHQRNKKHEGLVEFYLEERFSPQLRLAVNQGYLEYNVQKITSKLSQWLEDVPYEKPTLIHGDLWSGNYLIHRNRKPYVIDPAISFSHREQDLAMTKLFGGFSQQFYDAYNDCYPLKYGWEERMQLFQLYYLLAHLNMFGRSYLGSVVRILDKL